MSNSGRVRNANRAHLIMTRRSLMVGAGSLAFGGSGQATPTALPGAPSILVAGPQGGRVDQWAAVVAPPLSKSLLQGGAVSRENVGGPDGVTGANHFQTNTVPDGATAMMMPGATAISWLVGDPRVRFDAGNWAPLWGGAVSAVAATRVSLAPGRRVRVATDGFVGPELAALLALDLMGIDAVPVAPGVTSVPLIERSDVDLVLLRGTPLKQGASDLAAKHWTPGFALGAIGAEGRFVRDPAWPDLPTAFELIDRASAERAVAARSKELSAALRAATAAATLDIGLVLPLLSPAAIVAWWRQGCTTLASAADVQDEAARNSVRPMEAGSMAATMTMITADPNVLLELRRWLAERHQWRPG